MWQALAVASLLGAASPTPESPTLTALQAEQTALADRISPSVVLIVTKDGFGSGFFVSTKGHLVTNKHVVGRHKKVKVVLRSGKSVTGTVRLVGERGVDVALVETGVRNSPALSFAPTSEVSPGSWAASVGHGEGGGWTFTAGLVTNAHGRRSTGVLQTQIPLNPGASGGPVIGTDGRVIGVVTAGLVEAQAINFAISAEAIGAALPGLCRVANCVTVHADAGASIFVDGRLIGQGPQAVFIAEPRRYRVEASGVGGRRKKVLRFPATREVSLVVREGGKP